MINRANVFRDISEKLCVWQNRLLYLDFLGLLDIFLSLKFFLGRNVCHNLIGTHTLYINKYLLVQVIFVCIEMANFWIRFLNIIIPLF